MGRCQEFGPQIRDGCGHAMRPGESACFCPECGVTCQGLYAGCPDVWRRGPRTVNTAVMTVDAPRVHLGLSAGGNGRARSVAGRTSRALPELDAGSAPERNGGAEGPPTAGGNGGPAPERVVVPESEVGAADAAEHHLDALLEQDDPVLEGELLAKPEQAARREYREPVVPPDLAIDPEPAAPSRLRETSEWDPSSLTESLAGEGPEPEPFVAPTEHDTREAEGDGPDDAPRDGAGQDEVAAVPAELDESDPRTHVLKWMEKRFDGLRAEVQTLANGASRQQETLEEIAERQAEMEARLEQEAERTDEAEPRPVSALDDRAVDLLRVASDELGKLVDEVVTALQETRATTASAVAAQNENTERLRLLQTAVTRQLRTMTAAVGEWEKRSDERVAAYSRRVEALAKRVPAPRAAPERRATATARSKAGSTAKAPTTAKRGVPAKATGATKASRLAKRTPAPAPRRDPRPRSRY